MTKYYKKDQKDSIEQDPGTWVLDFSGTANLLWDVDQICHSGFIFLSQIQELSDWWVQRIRVRV